VIVGIAVAARRRHRSALPRRSSNPRAERAGREEIPREGGQLLGAREPDVERDRFDGAPPVAILGCAASVTVIIMSWPLTVALARLLIGPQITLRCGVIAEPALDAPDEDWLVWADAMQQLGNPRGELIALANHPALRDAHVKKHSEALLGRVIGRYVRKGHMRVTWRRARVDELELRIDEGMNGPQLIADVLGSPVATEMRGLAIAGVPKRDRELSLATTLGWLRESTLPRTWTSLALVDDRAREVAHMVSRETRPDPNLVDFGPLYELWRAFPWLEHLRLVVANPSAVQFGRMAFPELRSFTLHTLFWGEGLGQLLAEAEWPRLSSLELRLVDPFTQNNPTDRGTYRSIYRNEDERDALDLARPHEWAMTDELAPLFESLGRLPLERLALTSFHDADRVLTLLEEHTLPSLVELDLSDSSFGAAHAERLANNPLLLQLRRLVLERVALASPKAFGGLDLEVVHSHSPDTPTHRYIVGWE